MSARVIELSRCYPRHKLFRAGGSSGAPKSEPPLSLEKARDLISRGQWHEAVGSLVALMKSAHSSNRPPLAKTYLSLAVKLQQEPYYPERDEDGFVLVQQLYNQGDKTKALTLLQEIAGRTADLPGPDKKDERRLVLMNFYLKMDEVEAARTLSGQMDTPQGRLYADSLMSKGQS